MTNVVTCSRERFNWAVEVMDKALAGEEVEARDAFGAGAILGVVGEAAFGLAEEVEQLRAEVERLKAYTEPRLFAAASDLLEVAGKGSDEEVDLALVMLTEAVAWWDSLPFDPAKDVEKLPKYEG